jgi:hypothetical protein
MPRRRSRKRTAQDILNRMSALDHAGDHPAAERERARLREEAAATGLRLVSMAITHEPLPDPLVEALPRTTRRRLDALSHAMYTEPAAHLDELRSLAAEHPKIPIFRNYLAVALKAAGRRDEAKAVLATTSREFPLYVFGYCNYIINLLADGEIEEARKLAETGPRGPVFTLNDFDPTRTTFHFTEVIAHANMVGRYMLATDRPDAAKDQVRMLRELDPECQHASSLEASILERGLLLRLADKLRSEIEHGASRNTPRAAKAVKPESKRQTNTAKSQTQKPTAGKNHKQVEGGRDEGPSLFDR